MKLINSYQIKSLKELADCAEKEASFFSEGDFVNFIGNLGAGKTTLIKHLASLILKIDINEISSPTFALHHLYQSSFGKIHHLDLYRLENIHELESIGLDELLTDDAIVFMEWGERFSELSRLFNKQVALTRLEDTRTIQFFSR